MKWGNKTVSLENNKSGEIYKSNYIILPNMDLQKHHNKIIESINNNYNTIRTLSYKMILNQKIRSGLSKISPIKSIYTGGNNDINESIIYNIINDIEKEQLTYYDMFISNLNLKLNEINETEDKLVRDLYQIIIMFLIKQFKIFDEYGNISEKYRYEILDTSMPMSISPIKIRNMTRNKTPVMTPDKTRNKTPVMTPGMTPDKTPNMTPDKTRNKTLNLTTNKSYINKKLVFPENIENMNVIEEKIDVSERPSRSMKTKKSIGSIQSNVSTKSKKM